MVMTACLAGRSICTRLTEAWASFFLMWSRTARSCCRYLGNSLFSAYHLEVQSVAMPKRKPVGFTFCPMISLPLIRNRNGNMAGAFENPHAATLGARAKPLHMRTLVNRNCRNLQRIDVRACVVFRIGNG